jgi:hypothetical protein
VPDGLGDRLRGLLASDVYTEKGRLRADDLLVRERVGRGPGAAIDPGAAVPPGGGHGANPAGGTARPRDRGDWTLVGQADALAAGVDRVPALDELDAPAVEASLRKLREVMADRQRYVEIS